MKRTILFFLMGAAFATAGHAQTISVGSEQTVMSASDRSSHGMTVWPDGTMHGLFNSGTNFICAADGGEEDTRCITSVALDSLASNISLVTQVSNLHKGSPGAFDQNYAGGGPIYYDANTGILLHLYHAEYWYSGSFTPFYGSIGFAYSTDWGATWHKLGQVISPQTARSGTCQVEPGGGTLVPVGSYFYLYYTDMAANCNQSRFEIAVARASISDVIAAAQAGAPLTSGSGTLFKKYYQGDFTQNGVTDLANPGAGGGAFTPLFSTDNKAWWPDVAYNSYVNKYVMVYAAGWNGIDLRFSDDGINWSSPTRIVDSHGAQPPNAVYYPSLLNTGGGDPEILGQNFYVYYVAPFGTWANSNLDRVNVSITSASTRDSLGGTVTTTTASLSEASSGGSPGALVIVAQPEGQLVPVGYAVSFSVAATGSGQLTYQWFKNGNAISGATESYYRTMATTAADNGASFTVVISNGAGAVTSSPAALTVSGIAGASVSSGGTETSSTASSSGVPVIVAQPEGQLVPVGYAVSFSVAATGSGQLTYQWFKNGNAISGATESYYRTMATTAADNGASFTVVISNGAGEVTSNPVTLVVSGVL